MIGNSVPVGNATSQRVGALVVTSLFERRLYGESILLAAVVEQTRSACPECLESTLRKMQGGCPWDSIPVCSCRDTLLCPTTMLDLSKMSSNLRKIQRGYWSGSGLRLVRLPGASNPLCFRQQFSMSMDFDESEELEDMVSQLRMLAIEKALSSLNLLQLKLPTLTNNSPSEISPGLNRAGNQANPACEVSGARTDSQQIPVGPVESIAGISEESARDKKRARIAEQRRIRNRASAARCNRARTAQNEYLKKAVREARIQVAELREKDSELRQINLELRKRLQKA